MLRLNPFAKKRAELIAKAEATRHAARAATLKAKRSKEGKAARRQRTATYHSLQDGLLASYKAAEDLLDAETKAGNYQPGETDEEEDEE
jgi:hypothetical protein